jgi:lipopolysaccharide biosynthesis regulator YciM
MENKQFPFKASAGWVQDLKKKHKIRQRHVTKYIRSMDNVTSEEKVKAAELFKKQSVTKSQTTPLF